MLKSRLYSAKNMIAPVMLTAILANGFAAAAHGQSNQCPAFQPAYNNCEVTSGPVPSIFHDVTIAPLGEGYVFNANSDFGPIHNEYHADLIVRLGSDYHYLPNGEVLADLPSHESSHCADDSIMRNEVTYLPGGSYARETITMSIADNGNLDYVMTVNGQPFITAMCSPS